MPVPCLLCGFGVCRSRLQDSDSIFFAKQTWQKYRKRKRGSEGPGYHFVKADEIEKLYSLSGAYQWQSLHRLIKYDSHYDRCWISGIGQYIRDDNTKGKFLAPTDCNRAFIGVPPQSTEGLTQLYDGTHLNWLYGEEQSIRFRCAQLPVVLHMRCWNLAQWVLGSTLEENLELFVAISLKRVRISTLQKDPKGVRSSLPPTNSLPYSPYSNDPCRFWAIKERMQRSNYRKKYYTPRSRSKKKPIPLSHSRFAYLPNDVIRLILDVLSCKDILKLTRIIQIPVSDDYWRFRAAQNLFEIDDMKDADHDMPYLAQKMEELYNTHPEFATRRHVHDILCDMKPLYVTNLKKRTFPSLDDVINEIQDENNQNHKSLSKGV